MPKYWPVGVVLCCMLLPLGVGSTTLPAFDFEPVTTTRVARQTDATTGRDTVRTSTSVNTPVVLSLPSRVEGDPVSHYAILRAPALAGVAKRSFTWIPAGDRPGVYDARLEAVHPDAASDTVTVRIELKPD